MVIIVIFVKDYSSILGDFTINTLSEGYETGRYPSASPNSYLLLGQHPIMKTFIVTPEVRLY